MFALAACSEDTEPESGTVPAAVETTTTTAPATSTSTTTTTAAPTATTSIPTDVDFEVSIGDDTVWRDVLDVLAEAEQDCIIEALGDEFESLMDLAVLSGDDELAEFLPGLIVCALELLLLDDETVPSDGDDYGDLIDDATPVASGEAVSGTLEVDGDADVFVFEAAAGESYQIDVAPGTLEDPTVTLYDADGFELAYNDDYGGTLASRLSWEAAVSAPLYVGVEGYGTGTGTYTLTVAVFDFVDDHSNLTYDATPAALGEAVSGTLEVDGDADVFVFEAAAGESYQIDVAPGTLEDPTVTLYDPTVTLYDADGFELAYNGGTLASRLYWEAAVSAPLYIGVEGYGTGTYTLTVAVLDFVDDHGDRNTEATPAALGEAMAGVRDYDEDVDVFMFEAVAGELYQIDVTPGTLEDPTVTLRDADGFELAYNDDYGGTLASRLYWEAAVSAPLYIGVEGYGTGTYTLTVAVLDFVDDHGDRNTEATPAALGEAMAGVRDYDEDVDVFMFEAVAGELYQIDVAPGTLEDPTVTLRDADGFELAYNDDHAETPASRLYWEATNSGPHYVAVSGHDTGTYTLTIAQR